jgi:MFS family permease
MTSGVSLEPAGRRRFTIFLTGQAISLFGDGLALLAIPLLVLQITGNPFTAALSAAPRTVGYLLAGLPAGPLVDRFNARTIMLLADTVRFAAFSLLAVLSYVDVLTAWMVLLIAFVAAAAGVFFETALAVVVRDATPDDQLVRVNSLLESINQLAYVLGPGAVGVLAGIFGLRAALVVNALTFAVSLVTIFVLPDMAEQVGEGTDEGSSELPVTVGRLVADLRTGLRYLRSERLIFTVTCLQASINFCVAVETLIIFYGRNTLGLSSQAVSVVVACGGVGGILGASTATWLAKRIPAEFLIAVGVAAIAVVLVLLAAANAMWSLAVLNLVMGGASIVAVVRIRALRQQLVPRHLLGRVSSTARMLAFAAYPIGAAVAGALTGLNHSDPRPVFLGAGMLGLVIAAVAWFFGLRIAGRPAVDLAEPRSQPSATHAADPASQT